MTILITGENGYIAKQLNQYITNTERVSVRNLTEDQFTFFQCKEVMIHTAAIVHKKETLESEATYFQVNTELTYNLAVKAKEADVKQFIFLSTMAVYGDVQGAITTTTATKPVTFYGKSKLAAEERLLALQDEDFKVAIVRPPMVYGPNCPGNYVMLSKLSQKVPLFPKVNNKRSMIFIDNLCEFVNQLIQHEDSGIFHPQDSQYITTSTMVKVIAKANGKAMYLSSFIGKLLKVFIGNKAIYQKVFGDLYYDKQLSSYRNNSYQKYNLEQAIAITERAK
ncbi:hypothetical protein A0U40_08595 [[Bacillus] sp. KCTC 13219]|nr:hypothetical protein A0U40_08595 [[Bacillus] sp. KCTC 13219]